MPVCISCMIDQAQAACEQCGIPICADCWLRFDHRCRECFEEAEREKHARDELERRERGPWTLFDD